MSFSSRRRNYLLTPHRRDGLIEWMKNMLMHSFVLDALETTGADTFSHFEELVDEHRQMVSEGLDQPSRLKQLVPTVGVFHTRLPLRRAFEAYNAKHRLTKRRHVYISFNEIRHILNLAQIMAMRKGDKVGMSHASGKEDRALVRWSTCEHDSPSPLLIAPRLTPPPLSLNGSDDGMSDVEDDSFSGPKLISFDGDQTLYSDGANFDSNPKLASYLYLLLKQGVTVAVVTAAGYEYQTEKYEFRLSGLLQFFCNHGLSDAECERFYLFGGECNYLLRLGKDYKLHAVRETGPGGWMTSTMYLEENSPGNWTEQDVTDLLDVAEASIRSSISDQKLRARFIRKKRAVGLIPTTGDIISRESLDESVLRVQDELQQLRGGRGPALPFCAFNGGRDVWVDVGNKRVGVQILQSYLGLPVEETLHIGDQFLNTGNDFAARDVCPCIWITSPAETTYILKSILRLAGVSVAIQGDTEASGSADDLSDEPGVAEKKGAVNFSELDRRLNVVKMMDVYTGEMKGLLPPSVSTASLGDVEKRQASEQ